MNFYVRKEVSSEELESTVNDLIGVGFNVTIEEDPRCETELFYEAFSDIRAVQRKIKLLSKKGWIRLEYEEREAVIEGKEYLLTGWKESGVKYLVTGWRKHGEVL